ncbi:transposable element Tc1 transposase [Trichonephila clavipes]|uniref:Transposable element Tc1 transposase n=1 Tax=Trichonephila clavipes TaxID=2585209 RepID=A0A8X6W7P6_TRICX|nr:transposable element Tc1 transposase [Trichonephila clavipes]
MRVWKQCTDEHRTTRKTGSGRRKVTSARDDRHLLCMAVNDHTASSRQITFTANHRRLCLQWAHEHRAWHADWHQVVFSDESRFNLWEHDSRIRVRRYAGERCLPQCVIERYNGQNPGVMSPDMSSIEHVWDLIGRRLVREPRPVASKDELMLRI